MRTWQKLVQRLAGSPAVWATAAASAIAVAGAFIYMRGAALGSAEEKVSTLDPAQVVVLRTPGGFLDVSTVVKTEEFRWRSSYTCAWRDCGPLIGERIGRIRIAVHYTYPPSWGRHHDLRARARAYRHTGWH